MHGGANGLKAEGINVRIGGLMSEAIHSHVTNTEKRSYWVAVAVTAISIIVLYGLVKYCFGYGSIPITLSAMLWALWNDYGDWQHGMLVPFLIAWLVYRDREALARLPVQGSAIGLLGIVFSLGLYWAGFRADIQYAGFVSFQTLLASLVLWFLGWAWLRALMFPLAFMVFMWPFLFLDNFIAFPLRLVMAEISYRFLDFVGLDVIKEGSGIVSAPDPAAGLAKGERFQVDIADPCSGIRSLFALTMISALYAHLTLRAWWSKWTLFLMALPLAVAGNFFRILMLTFGTLAFGSEFAIGTIDHPSGYHMAAGFVVFAIALAGMVGLGQILRLVENKLSGSAVPSSEPTPVSA